MSSTITSRVARKPIVIPPGVNINLAEAHLEIKGSKGQISLPIHPDLKITINNGILNVDMSNEDDQSITGTSTGTSTTSLKPKRYFRSGTGSKLLRSIPGTTRAKIQNAVNGVSKGFER